MKIKTLIVFAFTFAVLFLMNRCEDEKPVPRDYPRLNTMPVTNISDSGALFTGEIYTLGKQDILEYGFVWGKTEQLSYDSNDKVILGTQQGTGTFNVFINSSLTKGVTYWVRPFAKTSECIVYGKAISFTSLGSSAPLITRFYPDSAAWGDTITISGKRFSWVPNKNIVKLDGNVCPVKSSTDTSVTINIPTTLVNKENVLSVALEGNIGYYDKKFMLKMPRLINYNPKQGWWGDTVLITGYNLGSASYQGNSVKLGSSNCTFVKVSDDSLWVKVPNEINKVANELTLTMHGINLAAKQNFQLLKPYFSFTPTHGTWGSRIKLYGRFNAIAARNNFAIGALGAAVASSNAVSVEIIVPASLTSAESQIRYSATPFEVASSENFVLLPPQITSFSPASGGYNASITINGSNFGVSKAPIVKFGDIQAPIISWTNTKIVVSVPNTGSGLVKISVTAGSQSCVSTSDFDMKNFRITNISPLSGTFRDQVTISVENLNPSGVSVQFGSISATVKSATSSSIIVEVPDLTDTVPKIIKVTSGQVYALSAEKFTLLPPEIISVTPSSPGLGSDIIITGRNFHPNIASEKLFLDLVYLTIKSGTATEIVATLPQSLPRGNHRIGIRVGGYTRYSTDQVSISSPWLRIPSPSLSGSYNLPIAGIGLQSNSYLCSPNDGGSTYRFDEETRSFTKLNVTAMIPTNNGFFALSVKCQGKFYIFYNYSNIKVFDETTETWSTQTVDLTYCDRPILFSLNGKLYFGGGSYHPYDLLYEIDPIYKTVKTLAAIPGNQYAGYTSWNDKGYVIYSNNTFYRYDPLNDTWTRLANFPSTSRTGAICFALGDYLYFGAGRNTYDKSLNDLWRFDPSANTWTQVISLPIARDNGVAFTANGKAYIGYGRKDYSYINDFYEYDPNY